MHTNTLRIFGQLTDLMHTSQLEVQGFQDTDALKAWLFIAYPALKSASFVIAVNLTIIQQATPIANGDTLALMPPFSGG